MLERSFCVHQLLEEQKNQDPDAIALLAPGRQPIRYLRLWRHVNDVVKALNEHGIGAGDRVAIVLANGPEMATGFLAVSAAAACAPLNPAYRANEFDFYLSDLRPKALIVEAGVESPSREVARARGIQVVELSPHKGEPAGIFSLKFPMPLQPFPAPAFARADDVALVLHTSGTTSRPKIVPLWPSTAFAESIVPTPSDSTELRIYTERDA